MNKFTSGWKILVTPSEMTDPLSLVFTRQYADPRECEILIR